MISVDGKYDSIGKSRNKETIWRVVDKKSYPIRDKDFVPHQRPSRM